MISGGHGSIAISEIKINEYELAMRLKTEKGFRTKEIEECFQKLESVVNCRYSFYRTQIDRFDDGYIDLGFGRFCSEMLVKNLKDCQEVFVFAVTLGIGVDRLLNRLSAMSASEYFITDAIASAMAEGAMDETEARVKGEILCRPRFSPGFADFSIENQKPLLDALNAQKVLGITLSKSYLMTPVKSVTAVMGIK